MRHSKQIQAISKVVENPIKKSKSFKILKKNHVQMESFEKGNFQKLLG